ncbi:MAG TPA: ABC transporter substrate-binding protein [Victivallales bacterium]|nr:ABC transporter substrate-binding protein [Victivallales bacterium]
MKRKYLIIFGLILLLAVDFYASNLHRKEVYVALQWQPQAEFAGYYVAQELGFYKEHGFDVKFIHENDNSEIIKLIKSGKTEFAVLSLVSAIVWNDDGLDLINIAQMQQKSDLSYVAKYNSGIFEVSDINNKRVALYDSEYKSLQKAFLNKHNIEAILIPVISGINLFLYGGVDLLPVKRYNEYHTLLNSGLNSNELTLFPLEEYGLDIPGTGIYCRKSFYKNNPSICNQFVNATVKGWQYAFNNPDKAIKIVNKRMYESKMMTNSVHQKWMLNRMDDIMIPGKGNILNTHLNILGFELTAEILKNDGIIKTIPKYNEFYMPVGNNVKK